MCTNYLDMRKASKKPLWCFVNIKAISWECPLSFFLLIFFWFYPDPIEHVTIVDLDKCWAEYTWLLSGDAPKPHSQASRGACTSIKQQRNTHGHGSIQGWRDHKLASLSAFQSLKCLSKPFKHIGQQKMVKTVGIKPVGHMQQTHVRILKARH